MSHGHLSLVSPSNLIGGLTTNHIRLPQVRNDGPLKRNLFVRFRTQPICKTLLVTFPSLFCVKVELKEVGAWWLWTGYYIRI